MNPNVGDLIARYRDKGVLIDTNLLLVLLVGNIDLRLIGKTARTDKYSSADYERIRDLLVLFNRLILLPQVLTEAGNLLRKPLVSRFTVHESNRIADQDGLLFLLSFGWLPLHRPFHGLGTF